MSQTWCFNICHTLYSGGGCLKLRQVPRKLDDVADKMWVTLNANCSHQHVFEFQLVRTEINEKLRPRKFLISVLFSEFLQSGSFHSYCLCFIFREKFKPYQTARRPIKPSTFSTKNFQRLCKIKQRRSRSMSKYVGNTNWKTKQIVITTHHKANEMARETFLAAKISTSLVGSLLRISSSSIREMFLSIKSLGDMHNKWSKNSVQGQSRCTLHRPKLVSNFQYSWSFYGVFVFE